MAEKLSVPRRKFLKNAAAGSIAGLVAGSGAIAASKKSPAAQRASARVRPPEQDPSGAEVLTTEHPGSDFMVEVIKYLGIEHIAANPGASFRGLHESVINFADDRAPELILCCHEEIAVALGQGYFKIAGKPLGVFLHSDVGTQHASMAIFNAYCDRVPILLMAGNILDSVERRPGAEWLHSAEDDAAMVRDCLKWDDTPTSLQGFADSAVRAYQYSMTPPYMPVFLVVDSRLQENPVPHGIQLRIPKLASVAPPQGDSATVAEAAQMLVSAENPVIIAGRAARTAAGMRLLVELAETLQASVIDRHGRMNFPTQNPLCQTSLARERIEQADVILGLELDDFWGNIHSYRDQLHRTYGSIIKPGTKLISIMADYLYVKGNYQDDQRYTSVNLAIGGDAEATLPSLIESVNRLITPARRRVFAQRGKDLAEAHAQALAQAREAAMYAWNNSPISTARLSMELWSAIRNEDWSLVADVHFLSNWPLRLWDFTKYYQYIGGAGGLGQGYGMPAAVGAALANRKHGRFSVNIQRDGDLMYAPGALWTAAHHRIPLLTLMHNNRAYMQEVMHVERMCCQHNRGINRAYIGTALENPFIDYAKIAQGMGVYGEGPITEPDKLGPAIRRAVEVVKRGEPALVDVVTEPR